MIWYIIAIIYSLTFAYFFSNKLSVEKIKFSHYDTFKVRSYSHVRQYLIILLVALLPLIIMAIRYKVGTDYAGTYTYDFYYIKSGIRSRNEPLSYLLYKVAIRLSENVQSFFILSSFICVFLTYISIYRLSVSPIYSILMYFLTYQYFTSMNAVRQAVATSVILFFLPFLFEKKYIKFLIGVVIAGLFHYAAFLYVILIPISMVKINYKKAISALLVIYVLLNVFKERIYLIIGGTVYGHYLNSGIDYKVSVLFMAVNFGVLIVMILNYNNSERYSFWMNVHLIMLLFCVIQDLLPLMGRVVQLFSAFRFLILPEIYINIRKRNTRLLFKWGMVAFYGAYCIYGMVFAKWDDVLPYQVFFGKY